ncbi:MAG: hypothetical protein KF871_01680 [Hydrogenophaga sp.]|uniref:hypothetical protein n=1 Tax=Hydrogenophaga sp. TaxID=1904254 RepID=UPI001D821D92|nr:hypothetical protein [Hydrogenophaga sp.]MBX3608580.1 hypothetical protein [Hydrogenophaga sp.]
MGAKYWTFCLAYSAIFPVTGALGGSLQTFGILLTFPFLPLAYMGGMAMVALVQSNSFYLLGAFLSIFAQVLVIAFCLLVRKQAKEQQA